MAAQQSPSEQTSNKNFVVLVAFDASSKAEYALNYYFDHLHRSTNELVLIHVIELPDLAHSRDAYMSPGQVAELWEEERKKSTILEEKYRGITRERGIGNIKVRRDGGMKPGALVVQAAKEEKADMIVMGTRGLGKIRRTFLGSVSDYVVHHSSCPVVVCRKIE